VKKDARKVDNCEGIVNRGKCNRKMYNKDRDLLMKTVLDVELTHRITKNKDIS